MLIYAVYGVCIAVLVLYGVFFLRTWADLKNENAIEKSSYFNNGVQIVFICLGSMVAAYSLDISLLDSEREQNLRTTELFDQIDIEKVSERSWQYRNYASLVFDNSYRADLNENERLNAIQTLWDDGIEEEFNLLSASISRLLMCGELAECNSQRIKSLMCSITDDLVRHDARDPTVVVPSDMKGFVYSSRSRMSEYQRRSCGYLYTAIDYFDETARR